MRKKSWAFALALGAFATVAASSGDARAQRGGGGGGTVHGGAARKGDAPGKIVVDRDMSSSMSAQSARARAAKGDCAGALDAFDEALRTSVDPSLHRDRGICHDRLGHPYPAMDDYRWYLTAEPNAPDAERIRERLEELEKDNGVGGAGTSKSDDRPSDAAAAKEGGVKTSVSLSGSEGLAHQESTTAGNASSKDVESGAGAGPEPAGSDTGNDIDADLRKQDQADRSPLRRGKGFVIGAVAGVQAWAEDSTVAGTSIAGTLRYSVGTAGSLLAEIGVESVGASESSTRDKSGPLLLGGYEARFGLDQYFSNEILLVAGFGYERLKQGSTGLVYSTIHPKARAGFRHVFGAGLGLEFMGEFGYALEHPLDVPAGSTVKSADQGVVVAGGTVALVLGF